LVTIRGREPEVITADGQKVGEVYNLLDAVLMNILPATKQMSQRDRIENAKKLLLGSQRQLEAGDDK
jgi:hypothetical protein